MKYTLLHCASCTVSNNSSSALIIMEVSSRSALHNDVDRGRLNMHEVSDMELISIAENFNPDHYIKFGISLGVSKDRLDQLEHDHNRSISSAITAMLIAWRKGQAGAHRDTRKVLSDALHYIGRLDLAETVYPGEEAVKDITPIHPCIHHCGEESHYFCESCLQTSCIVCVTERHKGHEFIPIVKHREKIHTILQQTLEDVDTVSSRILELKPTCKSPAHAQRGASLSERLREEIKNTFIDSVDALVQEKKVLLDMVTRIETACTGDIWTDIARKLDDCRETLGKDSADDKYYNNVTKFDDVIRTMHTLKEASVEGGVLSHLDDINITFIPNPTINLGRLSEPAQWYLDRKIDLPREKVGRVNACITLKGRNEVAVGYSNGGVDVIDIDHDQRKRSLQDVIIRTMVQTESGSLHIYNSKDKSY